MNQLKTKDGEVVRFQMTIWGNIPNLGTLNFSIANSFFIIKNENDAAIWLEVKPAHGLVFINTKFDPGWNSEIVGEVKLNVLLTVDELANIKWGN